ncbi:MAG: hypothetical protein MAG431_02063 [Chloroflexi bacterium]|nr:hypothetical protein [Chloroflexota bacterium]
MATVTLRPRGDTMRDTLRLRQVHGTLMSYPGNDRFVFQIFEDGQRHLIEFPDGSTDLNSELVKRLESILGKENVQVEKINYH